MIRIIQIAVSTGIVQAEMQAEALPAAAPSGLLYIDVSARTDVARFGGMTYTGTPPAGQTAFVARDADTFTAAPTTPAVVSVSTFLKQVTDAEYAAFLAKAQGGDATMARALGILQSGNPITPTDGTFLAMMTYAVSVNVLTQTRHDAILAALTS